MNIQDITHQGITELGYVRFGVSNLEQWREFAAEILALEVLDQGDPNSFLLRNDFWHHRISVEKNDCDDLLAAGFRVAGEQEFQDMQKLLSDINVPFEVQDEDFCNDRHVLEVMTLKDPGGNNLEIFHGPEINMHLPFHPAVRRYGKFVTRNGMGLGHVILGGGEQAAASKKMFDFYKLLGFRGSVQAKVPMPNGEIQKPIFMHCNDRDHTVAFGTPDGKSLNHIMLEVENFDDVMLTYQRVKDAKIPILLDLGRHPNDQQFSFYFATPSGFLIEIGHGDTKSGPQSEYYIGDYYGHEANPDFELHMGARSDVPRD